MLGQDIITEGEVGKTMYFLYRGSVAVLIGPEEKHVATLKDGSIFGELALLGNGNRTSTVRALEVCDCRVIDAKVFNVALRRFPEERQYFHEMANDRLKALQSGSTPSFRNAAATALASVKFKQPLGGRADELDAPTALDARRHTGRSIPLRLASIMEPQPDLQEKIPAALQLPAIARKPPRYLDRQWEKPQPLLANPLHVLQEPKRSVRGNEKKTLLVNCGTSFTKQWPGGLLDWVQTSPTTKLASLERGLDDLQLEAPALRAALRTVGTQRNR